MSVKVYTDIDKYSDKMYPADNFLGLSMFEKYRKGKPPTLIKIYGERHKPSYKTTAKDRNDVRQFLLNELIENPKSHLYIESHPHFHDVDMYDDRTDISKLGLMTGVSKLLHKKPGYEHRIHLIDRRKEKGLPDNIKDFKARVDNHEQIEPETIADVRNTVRDEISPLYDRYPDFKTVAEENMKTKNHRHPLFLAPLFDAEIIKTIEKASDEDIHPIFYVGNGHRLNVSQSIRDTPDIKGSGIVEFNKRYR